MLEESLQDLQEATNHVEKRNYSLLYRIHKLNKALETSSCLKSNIDIFELPIVSFDQKFAVFGSLILPLVAPIIKNVAFELKRNFFVKG
jgi:hypothetical protein